MRYRGEMNRYSLLLATLAGVVIGCTTSYVTRATPVTAQPGPSGYSECVLYYLHRDSDLEDLDENAKPIGNWTPVGGYSEGVVLCR